MEFYRTEFPRASVLPKMHLLEDHTIPWMRRWHLGAGLMGEHGSESIHSHIVHLERTYCGVPNALDRLKYIFNEYSLQTTPLLHSLQPGPSKRKKLNSQ